MAIKSSHQYIANNLLKMSIRPKHFVKYCLENSELNKSLMCIKKKR